MIGGDKLGIRTCQRLQKLYTAHTGNRPPKLKKDSRQEAAE